MKEAGGPDVSEEEGSGLLTLTCFKQILGNKVVQETLPGLAVLYSRRESFAYVSSCLPLCPSCAL